MYQYFSFIPSKKYLKAVEESHNKRFFYSVDPNDQKKTACYDIDVEVDDTLKTQMNSFLLSTASQQEIAGLDNKVQTSPEQSPAASRCILGVFTL